jgi:hypothetical protein
MSSGTPLGQFPAGRRGAAARSHDADAESPAFAKTENKRCRFLIGRRWFQNEITYEARTEYRTGLPLSDACPHRSELPL